MQIGSGATQWRRCESIQRPRLFWVESEGVGVSREKQAALVFLHGVTRCWTDWMAVLPEFLPGRRVAAVDLPGHGESEASVTGYRVRDYGVRMAEFVREEFTEPIVLVGHSLGAMVALWIAAEAPERVAAIVLEDPPFETMGTRIGSTPYQAQFRGMATVARMGGDLEARTQALSRVEVPTSRGWATLGSLRDQESLRYSAECLGRVDPALFEALVEGRWMEGYGAEERWKGVRCPALFLQGDPAAGGAWTDEDVAAAKRWAPAIRCRLEKFPGIGHQIHRGAPMRFLEVVKGFLAEAGV